MTPDQVRTFRQLGTITAGHPEDGYAEGAEATTRPLGQGLATAEGMAAAEDALRARIDPDPCDHRTWVIAGDGWLMGGLSQKAIALAGSPQPGRWIMLWDDPDITIHDRIGPSDRTDQRGRFAAAGLRMPF